MGLVAGIFSAYLAIQFLQQHDMQGSWDERLLFSDAVQEIMADVEAGKQIEESFVHGLVQIKTSSSITVAVTIGNEEQLYTFQLTPQTRVYTLANDEQSTIIPLQLTDVAVGDEVTVFVDAPIGSGDVISVVELLRI